MDISQYLMFVVITSTFLLSPGPSVLLSINNGVQYGIRSASIGILGNVVAFQLLMVLSAFGLGAVLTASVELFTVLKIVGALYLIYLGIKIWRTPVVGARVSASDDMPVLSRASIFKHAFFVTSSNPKALVYVSALLPQFIDGQKLLFPQIVVLGLTSAVIQFLVFMSYAVIGNKSRCWFENSMKLKVFNKFSGLTFIGFGVALGLSKK